MPRGARSASLESARMRYQDFRSDGVDENERLMAVKVSESKLKSKSSLGFFCGSLSNRDAIITGRQKQAEGDGRKEISSSAKKRSRIATKRHLI